MNLTPQVTQLSSWPNNIPISAGGRFRWTVAFATVGLKFILYIMKFLVYNINGCIYSNRFE